MKVLVTGGTGLIGWHACAELRRRGHEVAALARHEPPPGSLPEGVTFVRASLDDASDDDLRAVLRGADGVVHAAGADPRAMPRGDAWEFFKRVNVDGPTRLFRLARALGAGRAVFVTSYYHALRPDLAVLHPYVRSRVVGEQVALETALPDLALAIVQPPFIMGAVAGHRSVGAQLAKWARSRAPLLAPPGGSNWMSARALGEAIATALERGEAGRRYLLGDENVAWRELVSRFARAAGRRARVLPMPAAAVSLMFGGLHAWNAATGRDAGVRPVGWADLMTSDLFYDPAPAAAALGYRRGDLDESIRETVAASLGN